MKIIACASMSLDGYIADARGKCEWIIPEDDRIWGKLAQNSRAVIVGRKTFNQYYGEIYPVPGATTYVVTSDTRLMSEDPRVQYLTGGALECMRTMTLANHQIVVLVGGGETYGMFAAANLIDEAWISIYPLLIGAGTRLLGPYEGQVKLTLKQGYALPNGIVHNRYEVG